MQYASKQTVISPSDKTASSQHSILDLQTSYQTKEAGRLRMSGKPMTKALPEIHPNLNTITIREGFRRTQETFGHIFTPSGTSLTDGDT